MPFSTADCTFIMRPYRDGSGHTLIFFLKYLPYASMHLTYLYNYSKFSSVSPDVTSSGWMGSKHLHHQQFSSVPMSSHKIVGDGSVGEGSDVIGVPFAWLAFWQLITPWSPRPFLPSPRLFWHTMVFQRSLGCFEVCSREALVSEYSLTCFLQQVGRS